MCVHVQAWVHTPVGVCTCGQVCTHVGGCARVGYACTGVGAHSSGRVHTGTDVYTCRWVCTCGWTVRAQVWCVHTACVRMLPHLGAAIAIGLDHVLRPLLHLQLNGQLLLQACHAAQVGGRAGGATHTGGLGAIYRSQVERVITHGHLGLPGRLHPQPSLGIAPEARGGGAGDQQAGRQGDTRAQQSTHPPTRGNSSGLGQDSG